MAPSPHQPQSTRFPRRIAVIFSNSKTAFFILHLSGCARGGMIREKD
jgi:hypothetical protein